MLILQHIIIPSYGGQLIILAFDGACLLFARDTSDMGFSCSYEQTCVFVFVFFFFIFSKWLQNSFCPIPWARKRQGGVDKALATFSGPQCLLTVVLLGSQYRVLLCVGLRLKLRYRAPSLFYWWHLHGLNCCRRYMAQFVHVSKLAYALWKKIKYWNKFAYGDARPACVTSIVISTYQFSKLFYEDKIG